MYTPFNNYVYLHNNVHTQEYNMQCMSAHLVSWAKVSIFRACHYAIFYVGDDNSDCPLPDLLSGVPSADTADFSMCDAGQKSSGTAAFCLKGAQSHTMAAPRALSPPIM